MNKDIDKKLAELRTKSMEWATERNIAVDPRYISDQFDEGVERAQYGDIIGGSICMLRANAAMIAAYYTIDQLIGEYKKFNKTIGEDMLKDDAYSMTKSMESFFDVCDEIKKRITSRDIEDLKSKESQIVRANMFNAGSFIKNISDLTDKMRDTIGMLATSHNCDECDKDKNQCILYSSGLYKAVLSSDKRFREEVLKPDIQTLEEVCYRHPAGKGPIDRISSAFTDDEEIDSKFSLVASTALMLMGAYELPLGDCATISDIMDRYNHYEDASYSIFKEECENMGFSEDFLRDVSKKEIEKKISDLKITQSSLKSMKDKFSEMFNKHKPDNDKKDEKIRKPRDPKFGKN